MKKFLKLCLLMAFFKLCFWAYDHWNKTSEQKYLAQSVSTTTTNYSSKDEVRRYWNLAQQGDANAQYSLGYLYYQKQDYAQAFKWYQLSADQGVAEAQAMLGVMYSLGQSVPQNTSLAQKWFKRACLNGMQEACNHPLVK
ncbi:MAG: tetratricopeptide repeat protein [Haemophilus parainfluenzae]|jgi:hypothetical protein|nr:tetratricopeptide repeat protein [Haemophilus parainfluenzae]